MTHRKYHPHRQGFTLIELSIVITIIGLLVGGILFGRDLIKAAELRKIASEYTEYATAVNTFRIKYNCIPGDCAAAKSLFGSNTYNGNGDGKITPYETRAVCQHLSLAGLVKAGCGPYNSWGSGGGGSGVQSNINALPTSYMPDHLVELNWVANNGWGWHHIPDNNYLQLATQSGAGTWYPQAVGGGYPGGMQPVDAQSIDSKIDDGFPYTGQLIQADVGCGDTVTNTYSISSVNNWCANFFLVGQ